MADYIEREAVLAEYDRQHNGPPGGARKIITEFPLLTLFCAIAITQFYGKTMLCENSSPRLEKDLGRR